MRWTLAIAAFFFVSLQGTLVAQDKPEPVHSVLTTADQLASVLDSPDLVIMHVARESEHYDDGHVPGAVFVPLSDLVEERDGLLNMLRDIDHLQEVFRDAGISDESQVVVYGDLDGLSASRAFFTLEVLGHHNVAVLDGGLDAWRAGGYPLSTDTPETEGGTFTAHFQPALTVSADWIADHLGDPDVVLVDARPEEQYTGENGGPGIERPGHIPGAVNLFWQDSLDDDGFYRPIDDLRSDWTAAGVTADRTVVTYCRTGVQASHAYLTARLLGLAPRIYDPSFQEWSNQTEYSVSGE